MKKLIVSLIPLSIVALAGCSSIGITNEKDQLSQTERTCRGLKRNIIFSQTPKFNSVGNRASETERAEMLKLYDKYNCSSFEKKK